MQAASQAPLLGSSVQMTTSQRSAARELGSKEKASGCVKPFALAVTNNGSNRTSKSVHKCHMCTSVGCFAGSFLLLGMGPPAILLLLQSCGRDPRLRWQMLLQAPAGAHSNRSPASLCAGSEGAEKKF